MVTINTFTKKVKVDDVEVKVTTVPLLILLSLNTETYKTEAEIEASVAKTLPGFFIRNSSLRVHICGLNKKLQGIIITKHRTGLILNSENVTLITAPTYTEEEVKDLCSRAWMHAEQYQGNSLFTSWFEQNKKSHGI